LYLKISCGLGLNDVKSSHFSLMETAKYSGVKIRCRGN